MTPTSPRSHDPLVRWTAAAGPSLALAIALTAITGWIFGIPRLQQVVGPFPSMNPMTAFLLVLASAALLVRALGQDTTRLRWTATILGFLVIEVALLRLQELATGWNVGLDLAVFPAAMVRTTLRMAPATAAAFLLQGFALLTLDRGDVRGWWLSQLASTLSLTIAALALCAHAFGSPGSGLELFRLMSPPAALALGLIALGTLAARPGGALTGVALADSDAGRGFRRGLAIALTVPLALGGLCVAGFRARYYSPEQGAALLVAANALLLTAALWFAARTRARAEAGNPKTLPVADAAPPKPAEAQPLPSAEPDLERERQFDRERETELRDVFLSNVSDTMGSPLATVTACLEDLREGRSGALTPEQSERLEPALGSASRLRTMIHDLLETTRAQRGRLPVACRRVALRPVITDALDSLRGRADRKGVGLVLDPIFTAQDVEADPMRVVQILVNLVDNAIQYTPAGGSIRVSVGASGDRPSLVMLSVADTGYGIAPEIRSRIFERLQPGPRPAGAEAQGLGLGLGLGLSISRQLAQLMGGRLWFESQPGAGSTFHVELPVWSRRPTLARMAPRCVPGEPLALVSVEFGTSDGRPLGADTEDALLEAHRITGTCVLPDKDVLLPREGPADGRERFHLLARTHLDGAEVLRARVEGELRACSLLRDSGIRERVTVTPLPDYEDVPGMDPEDFLEGLITSSLAEQLLNEEQSDRAA